MNKRAWKQKELCGSNVTDPKLFMYNSVLWSPQNSKDSQLQVSPKVSYGLQWKGGDKDCTGPLTF